MRCTVLDHSGSFLLAAALQQFRPVILALPITMALLSMRTEDNNNNVIYKLQAARLTCVQLSDDTQAFLRLYYLQDPLNDLQRTLYDINSISYYVCMCQSDFFANSLRSFRLSVQCITELFIFY